jgi:hypothetical protein
MERRLRRHRHPLDIETLRKQIVKGGDQLILVFVPWWKRPKVEEPLKTYRSFLFLQDYFHQVTPFPRVRDLSSASSNPASAPRSPPPPPKPTSTPTCKSLTSPTSSVGLGWK